MGFGWVSGLCRDLRIMAGYVAGVGVVGCGGCSGVPQSDRRSIHYKVVR